MTASAYLSPQGIFRGWDNNGAPLIGGLLTTYQAGTTTPVVTWTDATATTPNENPVVLNARGEANVWLLPNVGYKYVLTDSAGNPIWTEDNIFLSQLLTLYGGVDTGAANAYILNFNANFTALTDGIVLYWIPSNSATGPSTINVNGLGAVPIVNQNGTALSANQLIANQIATIMYKGGNWMLVQGAAQGIVAYGGTDTGAVNAYVLPMTNQYFSYSAGNVIYWIPSATSTGASTVNIKGLGIKTISGTDINPGLLQAGTLVQMVYNGSSFTVVTPTQASGSFVLTCTGGTTAPTITVYYVISGNVITWIFNNAAFTSNSTGFGLTGMPRLMQGATQGITSPLLSAQDNGNTIAAFLTFGTNAGSQVINVNPNNNSGLWTASGTKGLLGGSFSYAVVGTRIV